MGVSGVTSLDTTYAINIDDASPTTIYVGEAPIGSADAAPVWRIRKLETNGTVLKITWADGDQHFNNVWDNRAALIYI